MYIVKYCKHAGNGSWIGWTEYNNGVYFNHGRTLDELVKNAKRALYSAGRVSSRQVYLDTKPSAMSDCPTQKMSAIFMGKYWNKGYDKIAAKIAPQQMPLPKAHDASDKYDYFDYDVRDGKLVVYGVIRREIDQFELRKNGGENDTEQQ